MYTYSLTVSLEPTAEQEWLDFMMNVHIPAIEDSGYFDDIQLTKIEEPVQEEGAVAYNLLCRAATLEHLKLYMSKEAPTIHSRHDTRFAQRFHAVDALLKSV